MTTVYLVGVDHRIQWISISSSSEWDEAILEFIRFVHENCESLGIGLIAEEFSEYLVDRNHAQDSTARRAAREIGLPHLFCDPDPREREELKIESDGDREKEWLSRIIKSGILQVLFVCGDRHLQSFQALLISAGHGAKIIGSNCGKGWELVS